jgi:hypothetical protein
MKGRAGLFALSLVPALAGACADDEPAPIPAPTPVRFESGTRLRANLLIDADGHEHFVSFYDSELDLDCSFHETTSGFRCLPAASADLVFAFEDASCTKPVAAVRPPSCVPQGDFVESRGEESGCPLPTGRPIEAFYRATELHENEPTFLGGAGACSETDFGATSFRELEELPFEDFAPAEAQLIEVSGGLGTRMLVSPDGAKLAVGLFDLAHGTRCTPYREPGSEVFRCLPNAAGLPEFSVALGDCVEPEGTVPGLLVHPACSAPPALLVDERQACPASLDVFAVGDSVSAESAFFAGTCSSVSNVFPGDYRVAPLAEPVDATTLPAVRERRQGAGRVTSRVATAADGSSFAVSLPTSTTFIEWPLFDELLNQPCVPRLDAEGAWRCISGPYYEPDASYGDPDCTIPVVHVPPCLSPVPPFAFQIDCGAGMGPITNAVAIGPPVQQTYIWIEEGVCAGTGPMPGAFLSLGERPLDSFPLLVAKRE